MATPGEITYVNIPIEFVVFNSTAGTQEWIHSLKEFVLKQGDRMIVVFGQHEELASSDAVTELSIISQQLLSKLKSLEYVFVAIGRIPHVSLAQGDKGTRGSNY